MMRASAASVTRSAGLGAGLGAALLLSACAAVGPDWKKPSPPLPAPATFPPGQGAPAPSQTVAGGIDPSWWDIFGDAELSALQRRVTASNLDLAEATARLVGSRAERRIVASERYLSSDMNASVSNERASPNGVLGLLGALDNQSAGTVANGSPGFGPTYVSGSNGMAPFNIWQYGFDASWELDLWGRVRRSVEASDAAVEASADMRRGVLVSVLAETARDYLQLRGIQAEIDVVQQNLDIAVHSLELTRLRFANGATTNLDVADAEAQVSSIRATLPGLKQREAELINALSYLVGAQPRALQAELEQPKAIPPVPPEVPVGLPSELAERRPDIRAAEAQLHQATAEVGVAVADFYPQITLSGSLDIQALQFSNLGTWQSRQYGVGPAFSMPLFEGGRLRGQLQLRKATQKQAAIAYQRTVLNAWREVDDALTGYTAVQLRRDQLAEAVRHNQDALATAQTQYAQGAADFLNVLTVQKQLLDTQRDLIRATADTDVALAGLYKALGGGWQGAADIPPAKRAARRGGGSSR
jgi:NodT family efflux transporter outer membrane factor (OMF) lipoprotein